MRQPYILPLVGIFGIFLALYTLTRVSETPYNEEARQADAFLHGHTYLAPTQLELARVNGRNYALHPPLAAILMIPLAAVWGDQIPQSAFGALVAAVDVALAFCLCYTLGLEMGACYWLTAFFGAGTILWFHAIDANTWFLPMLTSVCFTLAALIEVFGRSRPLLLGFLLGFMCLARYDLALTVPVVLALAYSNGRTVRELAWTIPGLMGALAFFVWFNEERYGTWFDIGLKLIGPVDGAFALRYLPSNLYQLLFLAPSLDGRFPWIHPQAVGQAITFTSPAFVLALRPRFQGKVALLGLATLLGSVPSLLCWTGGLGFGARHYLQVYPFLFAMMAMGMPVSVDQLSKVLIVASIVLSGFGVWHCRTWGYG